MHREDSAFTGTRVSFSQPQARRDFLAAVGRGVLLATVGMEASTQLGLAHAAEIDSSVRPLSFGPLDPLVALMQESTPDALLPVLAKQIAGGVPLKQLIAAATLANARTFGGEDYVGFHTMMALGPAYHMSQELPAATQALPVLKVLYRNTQRIQEFGGRKQEVLHAMPIPQGAGLRPSGEQLRDAVRGKRVEEAEQLFSRIAIGSADDALDQLLYTVQDNTEVHRVVLPYRAWDMISLIGKEQAHTLLRQSVRYCLKAENWAADPRWNTPRTLLPRVMEKHKLLDRQPGHRSLDDAALEQLSLLFFSSTGEQAAEAAAAALADGVDPATIGEAITLAANQLTLRDLGRTPRDESLGKPLGSVHGDSIGVHATDSANAWRNLSKVSSLRNRYACLILGAYQVAQDRSDRGGDFLHWQPLPYGWQYEQAKKLTDSASLLKEAEEAIRNNLQARASALIQRYGELGHPPRPVFDLLLRYAISEDGSLHAEKFYRTCSEEFATTRQAFRWRHVVALARVTASEFGRPAPGMALARDLMKG